MMYYRAMIAQLLMLTATVVGACDKRTPQPANVPQTGLSATPVAKFDFFDGVEFLRPSQWAKVPEPKEIDGTSAIGNLHIREVIAKYNDSSAFKDGIKANPQSDPMGHFVEDLQTIRTLGQTKDFTLRWGGKQSHEGYKDNLILPDRTEIVGVNLAGYFLAMGHVAREGGLLDVERDHNLSDHLHWIGFAVWKSDTDIASANPRLLILGAAWEAAFQLRKHSAAALGNAQEASIWERRSEELVEASKIVQRAIRAERNK